MHDLVFLGINIQLRVMSLRVASQSVVKTIHLFIVEE